MADEKKSRTIFEIVTDNTSIISPGKRMRSGIVDNDYECKVCGEKWCYKKWSFKHPEKKLEKVVLYESANDVVLKMLINAKNNQASSIDRIQQNKLYEPRLSKFIHDFSDRKYCFLKFLKLTENHAVFGYKFTLTDDKILYMVEHDYDYYAISKDYVYKLDGYKLRRLPKSYIVNDPLYKAFNFGQTIPKKEL